MHKNDQLMDETMSEIYPKELFTRDDAILNTHHLDMDLDIRNGKIHSKLFDKRDAFGFPIVNFPDLSGIPAKESYGVSFHNWLDMHVVWLNLILFLERKYLLID